MISQEKLKLDILFCVGCSPKNEIGIVSEGIDVPDTVSEIARE